MELLSPAKINLFLEVTGKRADGYHELSSLMCAISLYDEITLTPGGNGICVTCNMDKIPVDGTNLAARAAELFFRKSGIDEGVLIDLRKRIPAGAGLGGGSSNAAAVLTGLNMYYEAPLSADELLSLATSLGADVPFFVYSKAALATGIGERLEFCENIAHYYVLVVYPGIALSTAEVYKKHKFGLTKSKKETKSRLLNKGFVDPVSSLFNDLELSAFSICSEIKGLRDLLSSFGADGVLMSGSGSSVFGLYSELEHARDAFSKLQKHAKEQIACDNWQFFLVDLIV